MLSADKHEIKTLRELAKKVRDIAALPIQETRRQRFVNHNELKQGKPLVMVFPEGSWNELVDFTSSFESPLLAEIESELKRRIYYHEHIKDDSPIEGHIKVKKRITSGEAWLPAPKYYKPSSESGAWHVEPVINSFEDAKKIAALPLEYDEKGTAEDIETAQEAIGDILEIRPVGIQHISFHLMSLYIHRRGIDNLFMDMYDNPGMVHECMHRFSEGYTKYYNKAEKYGLISLNNEDTYHSSGGWGYTTQLPSGGYDGKTRLKDMWASSEVQELSEVSPAMHRKFAMEYESKLLQPFGLVGYGCCEALERKMDDIFELISNIRRISVSPFANVEKSAEKIAGRAIFSWKPNPAHLVGAFDENAIESYIDDALIKCRANGCIMEIILKDTHTCERHPERFSKWVETARKAIGKYEW